MTQHILETSLKGMIRMRHSRHSMLTKIIVRFERRIFGYPKRYADKATRALELKKQIDLLDLNIAAIKQLNHKSR